MYKLAFSFLAVCLMTAVVHAADQPKGELPAADAEGWISLFNGKDLSGWEGLEGHWSVVDGAIQCAETKQDSVQSDLVLVSSKEHPEKFANFELRYQWRMLTPAGNSGVQFRGKIDNPQTHHVGGYQADIDAGNGYTGIIYDEGGIAGGRGIMSKRGEKTTWSEKNARSSSPLGKSDAEIKKAIKPRGEWNDCVVTVNGNHMVYSINGQVTTEMTDNSPKGLKNGVIGLQMHKGFTMTIQFKDLRIKMLPETK